VPPAQLKVQGVEGRNTPTGEQGQAETAGRDMTDLAVYVLKQQSACACRVKVTEYFPEAGWAGSENVIRSCMELMAE
jgi:hypothetical protein